jgi:hypothetical protein
MAERVGPHTQQLAGVEVIEHDRVGLDPDADLAAAEDLRGEQYLAAQNDGAAAGDDAFDLDRIAGLDGWLTAPSATSRPRSVTVKWDRTVLTRVPPMNRWIRSTSAQNRTT